MSGGMEDANAVGAIGSKLSDAAHELRDAVKEAEAGHRGITVAVEDTVNPILLPSGWKLVRAMKTTVYT